MEDHQANFLQKAGRPWTEQDDQNLWDLVACKIPLRDIAQACERTTTDVRARIAELIAGLG